MHNAVFWGIWPEFTLFAQACLSQYLVLLWYGIKPEDQ